MAQEDPVAVGCAVATGTGDPAVAPPPGAAAGWQRAEQRWSTEPGLLGLRGTCTTKRGGRHGSEKKEQATTGFRKRKPKAATRDHRGTQHRLWSSERDNMRFSQKWRSLCSTHNTQRQKIKSGQQDRHRRQLVHLTWRWRVRVADTVPAHVEPRHAHNQSINNVGDPIQSRDAGTATRSW